MIKTIIKLLGFLTITIVSITGCEQQTSEQIIISENLSRELNYVGSASCADCHENEFYEWQQSHHFQAMREASSDSVLADFADTQLTEHNVHYRFYTLQKDTIDSYWVEITKQNGERTDYQIKYTFGYQPLQQYLIEFENGHIQALNMAWDSQTKENGGQRWFHLRPDEEIAEDNIFHWQRHYQNWNSRCADCHSTGLQKNYSVSDHTYDTQWAEINVACEACHGVGSEHVRLINNKENTIINTGFSTSKQASLTWSYQDSANIASASLNDENQGNEIDMCGACHSFRSTVAHAGSNGSYHDLQRLDIMNNSSYFPDGQIKEETFVLGSFLQSKMHASGVTCADCHNPHSGKVLVEGNGLCLQCHKPNIYNTIDHHQHDIASEGGQCISCHMPERTYMQVDARRDHSFVIPSAKISQELGSPNPCLTCHQDKDEQWLEMNIRENSSNEHWALTRQAFSDGEDVLLNIQKYVETDSQPVMRRAALLSSIAETPSQHSFNVAKQQLSAKEPLIRRAALSSMENMPMSAFLDSAIKLTTDSVRSVRFEAILLLLPVYQQLSVEQKNQIVDVLAEYKKSLDINADSPEGQLAIANFSISQLDFTAAEQAYQRAIKIEPNHIPSLINFADFYRATNRDDLGRPYLQKALQIAPNNSGANFAYAMLLIRAQEKDAAMNYLEQSTKQADSSAYYHYVYAVGLKDLGDVSQAREIIDQAIIKWPTDENLQTLSSQLR